MTSMLITDVTMRSVRIEGGELKFTLENGDVIVAGDVGGAGGNGVLNVSGAVNLDNVPGLVEVYAVAAADVEGVGLAAGDAAVFRYLGGSWSHMVLGVHTAWQPSPGSPPESDTTPPSGGVLAVTGTGASGATATLTVTGAIDSGSGLHALPYSFSMDGGTTWSAYQASNVYVTAALTAGSYEPRARVRDGAPTPNVATLTAATWTVVVAGLPFLDPFTEPDGTSVGGRSINGLTWGTSASDLAGFTRATIGIADIQAGKAASSTSNPRGAIVDVGTQVVRVSAKFTQPGAGTRISLGLGSNINGGASTNGIYLQYDNGTFRFRAGNNTTSTVIGTLSMSTPLVDVPVSIEYDGTTATAKVNGTTVGAAAVAFSGTLAGFEFAVAEGLAIDDFEVVAL